MPLQKPDPGAWVVVVVAVVGGEVVLAPGFGVVVGGSGGSSEWLEEKNGLMFVYNLTLTFMNNPYSGAHDIITLIIELSRLYYKQNTILNMHFGIF